METRRPAAQVKALRHFILDFGQGTGPALARHNTGIFLFQTGSYTTGPVEVSHQIEEGDEINIIDVRAPEDFAKGHLPGARNLPQEQWANISLLQEDGVNVLYCYSPTCHLAAKAAVEFAGKGFPVMEMDGGYEAWEKKNLPVEK